jgi:hypothetical protein
MVNNVDLAAEEDADSALAMIEYERLIVSC